MRQLSKTVVRLNIETRAFHAEADRPWLELRAYNATSLRHAYIDHLATCYGFDASLEAALAYTPHLPSLIDLHPRFRAGYIAEDLLDLGVSPADIASVPQAMIAPFASVAEAYGWLFVHQRSTLLHEGALAQLLEALPELAFATSYLRRNAGRVGMLWHELGQAIDTAARSEPVEERIVTAAIDASRAAIDWYRCQDDARHHREAI